MGLSLTYYVFLYLFLFGIGKARPPILSSPTIKAAYRLDFLPATTTAFDVLSSSKKSQTITNHPQETGGCAYYLSISESCENATPGFRNLGPSQQATCVCYRNGEWVPKSVDNAISSCAEIAFTAESLEYSLFSGLEDFCSTYGNFLSTSSTRNASSTTARTGSSTNITPTNSFSFSSTESEVSTSTKSQTQLTTRTPTPTPTPTPTLAPGSSRGIQDLKRQHIIGISVGCTLAGLLALAGVLAAYIRKHPKPIDETNHMTTNSASEKEASTSVTEKRFTDNPGSPVRPGITSVLVSE